MAWNRIPTANGSFTLNGNILANSVGESLDDMLAKAASLSGDLSNAIGTLKDQLSADVNGLTVSFGPSLDTATTFSVPTAPIAPVLDIAPSGPSPYTTLLDDAAYTGAFAVARDALLQEEQRGLWDADEAAAANGIGLPSAASQAMVVQAQQARRQAISQAALQQALTKAKDLREDLRWAYEQQLAYWDTKQRTILSEFAQKIQLMQASLASEAQKLAFKANANTTELERATQATNASLRLQEFATKISQDATLAYAGALAEQFKAWLAAVSFSASASAGVDNATYSGD